MLNETRHFQVDVGRIALYFSNQKKMHFNCIQPTTTRSFASVYSFKLLATLLIQELEELFKFFVKTFQQTLSDQV